MRLIFAISSKQHELQNNVFGKYAYSTGVYLSILFLFPAHFLYVRYDRKIMKSRMQWGRSGCFSHYLRTLLRKLPFSKDMESPSFRREYACNKSQNLGASYSDDITCGRKNVGLHKMTRSSGC
jgi:hypothetical protein